MEFPILDAHCHLDPKHSRQELAFPGAALAMTLSLGEAALAANHQVPHIAWGVGCHPRFVKSQEAFDSDQFESLLVKTAIVGEVGLDTSSRVSLELQLENFRRVLEAVSETPRLVSIHSYRASDLVLKELQQIPISVPVLHWWTGSAAETSQAVELGCYFSVHSAVARHSKFRTRVPPERILLESDHGYQDPPAAIPCRIEWVEHLVAQQYKLEVQEVRDLVWKNLATIVDQTDTLDLLSVGLAAILSGLGA